MSEYKKFDLEAALRGEKVLAIGPQNAIRIVTEVAVFPSGQLGVSLDYPQHRAWRMSAEGFMGEWRLVMAPKPKRKVKLWTSVFDMSGGRFATGAVYEDEAEAVSSAKCYHGYIATVPIEFEVEDRG